MEAKANEFRRNGHFDSLRAELLVSFTGSSYEKRLRDQVASVISSEISDHPVLLTGDPADSLQFIEKRVSKQLGQLSASNTRLPQFIDEYLDEQSPVLKEKISTIFNPETKQKAQTLRPAKPMFRSTHPGARQSSDSTNSPMSAQSHYDQRSRDSWSYRSGRPSGSMDDRAPYRGTYRPMPSKRPYSAGDTESNGFYGSSSYGPNGSSHFNGADSFNGANGAYGANDLNGSDSSNGSSGSSGGYHSYSSRDHHRSSDGNNYRDLQNSDEASPSVSSTRSVDDDESLHKYEGGISKTARPSSRYSRKPYNRHPPPRPDRW